MTPLIYSMILHSVDANPSYMWVGSMGGLLVWWFLKREPRTGGALPGGWARGRIGAQGDLPNLRAVSSKQTPQEPPREVGEQG